MNFNLLFNTPSDWVKAIVAALVAGLGSLSVGISDGLSATDVVGALSATLVAFGAVLGAYSKKDEEPTPPEDTTDVPDWPEEDVPPSE